jgi:hypothetical protein
MLFSGYVLSSTSKIILVNKLFNKKFNKLLNFLRKPIKICNILYNYE